MNNEPVGYFLYNEEYKEWEETHAGTPNSVPLYTHPAELTDDEIMDYVEAFSVDMGNYYEFQPDNVLQMIRSILDEAQEK